MIVLDTHAWVWWVSDPDVLTRRAAESIDRAVSQGAVHVSVISVWEVALLVRKGRLELTHEVQDWLRLSEALPFLTFVPLDNSIALRSIRLDGGFHEDPADRIIVATAMALEAPVVTKDRRIHAFRGVEAIW